MKNHPNLLLAFKLVTATVSIARAQLLTEGLDYANPAGTQLASISPWASSSGSANATIQVGNLTKPPLTDPVVTNDKKIRLGTANGAHYRTFSAGAIGSGSVYVSFLLNLPTLHTTDNYYWPVLCLDNDSSINLNSATGSRQARAGLVVYCQRVSTTTYRLGVRKNEGNSTSGTTSWGAASFTASDTVLVVGKYTFGAGAGDDTVALWLNPASLGVTEDGSPAVAATTSGNTTDSAALQYVVLVSASAGNGGGVADVDSIRVGQTWADVTPAGPVIGTKLGFTPGPANAAPGATMANVVVQIQNASGVAAASNGVPVTLSLSSGSGVLSGTLTQNTDATGKAVFPDLSIDTVGIKQLTATASGSGAGLAAATSASFSIVAQPVGTKLTFTDQPTDNVVNTNFGVTIQVLDANNLAVASNGVPITLTLSSGSGTLGGVTTRNTDATGKAVFNNLTIDTEGSGKQLTASAAGGLGDGLADAVSNPFNLTLVPVAARLAFTAQPVSTPVGGTLPDIVVQVQDVHSSPVATNGVAVTLSLTLGTGTVSGTTTRTTDATGKATFTGLSIDTAGAAKQFTASASGIGAGIAATPSAIFAITTGGGGAPVITQTVSAASSVILRGHKGVPNTSYRVFTTTNVGQPLATWTAIQTNTYSATGTFSSTNATSPGSPRGFFRLLSVEGGGGDSVDFSHVGFAGVDASGNPYGLTGGTNGSNPQDNIVLATNFATLGAALSNPTPLIIHVQGEIYMRTNGNFYVQANKTILGLGTNATLVGCLGLYGNATGGFSYACSNIIIRNLTLRNPDQFGEDDGIVMKYGAHHIWVDHCTFHDVYDGALDVTRESDFVTVSWCKFYYNFVNSHGDTVNLIGGSDTDTADLGKLHVTFHHNWWGNLARERMPSVRFGRAHVFNNYWNCVGNHYCVRARLYSEVLVENNYFDNVYNPWELATSSQGPDGKLRATGNLTNNCTFSTTHYNPNLPNSGVLILVPGTDTLSTGVNQLNPPPYAYTLDPAIEVPARVQTHAGAGQGPFAP